MGAEQLDYSQRYAPSSKSIANQNVLRYLDTIRLALIFRKLADKVQNRSTVTGRRQANAHVLRRTQHCRWHRMFRHSILCPSTSSVIRESRRPVQRRRQPALVLRRTAARHIWTPFTSTAGACSCTVFSADCLCRNRRLPANLFLLRRR